MNMISHTVGAIYGVVVLILCVARAGWHHNLAGILSGIFYGLSMIVVYSISSIYHGLNPKKSLKGKVIMRIIDHCDIYGLIVGSFAPVAMTGLRRAYPAVAWISFAVVCITSLTGIIFTAIDLSKYKVISYASYFIAGWSVIFTIGWLIKSYPKGFMTVIIIGGVVYTSGMIFFGLQKKGYEYSHGIFHIFIFLGSLIMSIPIIRYCM